MAATTVQGENIVGSSPMLFRAKGLNVNQAATDIGSFTGLPARYAVRRFTVENASAVPTLSTIDLRTATAGGGSAIVAARPMSGLTSSSVFLDLTIAITGTVQTAATLTIRSVAAAGAPCTVDFTLEITPLLALS